MKRYCKKAAFVFCFWVVSLTACVTGKDHLNEDNSNGAYGERESFENRTLEEQVEPNHIFDLVKAYQYQPSITKLQEYISTIKNIEQKGDEINIDIPQNMDGLYDFTLSFAPRQKNEEFYKSMREAMSFLYPAHHWTDECLKYCSADGIDDFSKNGNTIMKQKSGIVYFAYENLKNKNDYAHGTFASPIGNDLAHFCRGVGAGLQGMKYLEPYGLAYDFKTIAVEKPDSEAGYPLLDQEMRICDAVAFYENYLKSIPGKDKEGKSNTVVKEVYVFQLSDTSYGFYFWTTAQVYGMPIDWIRPGTAATRDVPYLRLMGMGSMVKSNEVDFAYGIYNSFRVTATEEYQEMIPVEEALHLIMSNLTEGVVFSLERIELIYAPYLYKGNPVNPEEALMQTRAAWKVVLNNDNDNLSYICYVDAKDGKHFRYSVEILNN